jgi:tetratricopeptide (TPR) repeat protein
MERDRLQGNSFSAGLLACLIAAAGLIVPSSVPGQTSPPAMQELPPNTVQEPSEQSLRAAVREAEKQYGPQSKELLKPLADLATHLTKNARYNDALEVLDRMLSIELREYGPEHLEVAGTFEWMADLHLNVDGYAKAEALYKRALAIREKTLGPDDKLVETLSNLAILYRAQKQHQQAEPLLQRVLTILEKTLGPEHPDVDQALNNLARLYEAQGQYAKAAPLYQRLLAIREKTLDPDHPDVARRINNLAWLYYQLRQYANAESLYQRSLAIEEKALGQDHPNVATKLSNLAEVYRAQGEYAKAEPLFQRSLAILEKDLDPIFPRPLVAASLDSLAALYVEQGQYAKAEPLLQRSLTIREKALYPNHPDVAASLDSLAVLYVEQGQYAKAEPLLQRSLTIKEKALDPNHPAVATSLNNLAALYHHQGQYIKAEPLYQRSLAILEKALGPNDPAVATSLNNLAVFYDDQGQYIKAEPLYQRSLAIREKALGPNHPDVAASLNNLAWLYYLTKQFENVLPLQMRALQIASASNVPETLWHIQDGLRTFLAREDQTDLAIFFGKHAVNTIQSLRGNLSGKDREAQHAFLQDKSSAYRKLADLLIDQGRLPEAQQVLAMLKEEELYDFLTRSVTDDNRKTTPGYNGIEETWQKRYREISSQLGSISAEYDELSKKKDQLGLSEGETKRRKQLDSDLMVARQAFDKFLGDLFKEQASDDGNTEVNKRVVENLQARQTTLDELGHGAVILN